MTFGPFCWNDSVLPSGSWPGISAPRLRTENWPCSGWPPGWRAPSPCRPPDGAPAQPSPHSVAASRGSAAGQSSSGRGATAPQEKSSSRSGGQDTPGRMNVALDLSDQSFDGVEAHLVAEPGNKRNPRPLVVEIAIKVQQVGFK